MSASPRILQCSGGIGPCSGATRWQRTPQVRLWLAWVLLAVAVGAACSADVAGAAESNPLARTGYKGELIDLPRDSLSWTDGHSAQSELVVAKARAQKLQWRSWRQRRSLQQAPGTPDGACGVLHLLHSSHITPSGCWSWVGHLNIEGCGSFGCTLRDIS